MALCQDWHILLLLPGQAAALGLAYALDGRVAAGLPLAVHGVEQVVTGGRPRKLVPVIAYLSEAYLVAGRLEEAHQHAAQTLDLARQCQYRGHQARALWLLGESTARQASPRERARRRPLPPGPRPGRGTRHASAPGALPPRPRHAVCHDRSARADPYRAVDCYRAVSAMEMTFWLPATEAALAQVDA